MDKIDLEELERLATQATPGPWVGRGNHIFCADNKRLVYVEAERALDLQTAAYIVAACNAVPGLIARVRELERQRDWLAVFIEDNMDCGQCPYFEKVCTPQAPLDCAEWIKKAAEEAGECLLTKC